ncbi:MAG: alpha/beta hydrolase [Cyclobacteriaceae bacterium]|nr:alpha/beta hydrolase [Cyclobacteriaceae bacterium]
MKTLMFIISLAIGSQTQVFAQEDSVIREERIYKKVNGYELKTDMFYSAGTQEKDNNPAIAFFHGGGWVFGDPSRFHEACKRYALKGFVTFSFQYRLSINEDGSYPHPDITPVESVKDARTAIRWLRENAESLRIDPEKIVVGGQSAGGQLVWATALFDTVNENTDNLSISTVPNAMLLYSSSYNTMEAWIDMLLGDRRDEIWTISPHHNLKENTPPVIAFHGKSDCMVIFYIVILFQEKMRELGNQFELVTFEDRKHYLGEGNKKYSRYFDEEILDRTDEFLKRLDFMPQDD